MKEAETKAIDEFGLALTQSGKLSIRGTFFGAELAGEPRRWENRSIGTLRYTLSGRTAYPFSVSLYGRSASDPSTHRTAYTIYHLQLEVFSPGGKFSGRLGRIYVTGLSGIGALDGVLVRMKVGEMSSAGAVVGRQPNMVTSKATSENVRTGAYLQWGSRWRNFAASGSIAFIGQYRTPPENRLASSPQERGNIDVDREFMYIQNRLSIGRSVNLFLTSDIDFDRKDISVMRDGVELSSLNVSLRIKPAGWVFFNSRYSARRNVKYFQTHASVPDSLFNGSIRTGWFNSAHISLLRKFAIQFSHSYRDGNSGSKGNQLLSTSVSARNFSKRRMTLRAGVSVLDNEQVRAYRSRLSASTVFWNTVKFFGEYELYRYSYSGDGGANTRRTLSFDMTVNISGKAYVSFTVDRSREVDLIYYNVYGQISYKF